MKRVLSWIMILFILSPSVFADPPGKNKGHVKEPDPAGKVKSVTKAAANEAVDAVADELLGEVTATASSPAGMPPGLAKKNKMPPGLAKKDKIPPGWSKGEKKSWNQDGQTTEKKPSLIRRMVRKVFHGSPKAEEAD